MKSKTFYSMILVSTLQSNVDIDNVLAFSNSSPSTFVGSSYQKYYKRRRRESIVRLRQSICSGSEQTKLGSTSTVLDATFQIDNSKLEKFRTGQTPYMIVKGALPNALINELRIDAKVLQSCGFGLGGAGLGSKQTSSHRKGGEIRKNVHQTWLQSCQSNIKDSLPPDNDRSKLIDAVEALRYDLVDGISDPGAMMKDIAMLSSNLIELSYLSYSPGSYYKCHIDVFKPEDVSKLKRQRVVSFLLYLGSDDEVNRQWETKDGGALRIFEDPNVSHFSHINDDSLFRDVLPHAGTLVLFDSSKVIHEVMETNRSRRCIVGWLNAAK